MNDQRHAPLESEYLWDRTGAIDTEIAKLEDALGVFRHEAPLDARRMIGPRGNVAAAAARSATSWRAAAVLALAVGGAWMAALLLARGPQSMFDHGQANARAWEVTALQGSPRVGERRIDRDGRLHIGQWLQTDAASQAQLAVASIGRVTVDRDTRLRLVESAAHEQRMELAAGRIEAFITAPPRLFIVDTPSATAVDLGCKYVLAVEKDGSGTLEVTLGWVSLERDGHEVIVPFGAMCHTQRDAGPGTPFYTDAPARLQRELKRFDFGGQSDEALQAVLEEAGPRDALTLFHLLARVDEANRRRVFDRLASLSPPPAGVERRDVLAGEERALARWRDSFMWSPPAGALSR